jgi:hypothetical protein
MKQFSQAFYDKGSMRLLLCLLLFIAHLSPFAQSSKYDRSKEIGLLGGTAYYIGELNPYKHFGGTLRGAGGFSYRNNHSKRWTTRASFLYGSVEAFDSASDDPWQKNRNLNFRNRFVEVSLQGELNFFPYQIGSDQKISPYLFAGIAYFQMNPEGYYKGNWYPLQPLGTEGQGMPGMEAKYKTGGMSVPAGFGLKVNLFAIFGASIEWGVRRTWTDYFDDVSGAYANPALLEDRNGQLAARFADQSLIKERAENSNAGLMRGDPGRKDLYFFVMASLNMRIDKKATSCWEGKTWTR